MMYDIVQFIGSGNEYLVSKDNLGPEVVRLVDRSLVKSNSMDAEIIEGSILSGGAQVIGQAKITVEISLI